MAAHTGMFNSRPTAPIYYAATLLYNYWAREPIRGTLNKIKALQRRAFFFVWHEGVGGNISHLHTEAQYLYSSSGQSFGDYLLSFCHNAFALWRAGSVGGCCRPRSKSSPAANGKSGASRKQEVNWSLLFIEAHIVPFTNRRSFMEFRLTP